jgi:predicted patatin/cPLA2 family phospholipase
MVPYVIIGIIVLVCLVVGYVANLDWMMQNHPHYKGEDLFDEQLDSKEITPEMIWNDKKKEAIARFIKAHKAIDVAAEKYAESTFKWPKNKLGENQSIPAGQSVPHGYRKHIKLTKKPFMDGALSETAKNYWYESFRNNEEQN